VSKNLRRRHLDTSQRATVAAKIATLRRGDNRNAPIGASSRADTSELLSVGTTRIDRATRVQSRGIKELQQPVEAGGVSRWSAD
jgi:hypothetical protein